MGTELTPVTWNHVERAVAELLRRHAGEDRSGIYGVPRGGWIPAAMVAARLNTRILDTPEPDCLVVDDLVDSGRTRERFAQYDFDALYVKADAPYMPDVPLIDGWVVFPWESAAEQAGPADAVVRLLQHIGEDPNREGLADTPARVLRAWTEMTTGYGEDPAAVLATVFDEHHDQMVVLDGIRFTSICEHHLLPFVGTAKVGYVPDGKVVGLSKLARIVETYARRLQVQERMTDQIAVAVHENLKPLGVGVVVRAHHSCMGCRGVRQPDATMTTSALLGILRYSAEARSEFLSFG